MWKNDEYIYTKGILNSIAKSYDHIYKDIETKSGMLLEANTLSIAEYKADFDRSLNAIGKGNWTGEIDNKEFIDFRHFGNLQRMVIADIYGITDGELEALGFYQIPQLKGRAYKWMANKLNGLPYGQRFVSRSI